MSSRSISLAAALVAIAACGGGTGATTSSPPDSTAAPTTSVAMTTTTQPGGFTVVSEDGDLEIEVPPDAMADDPGITIAILDPAEYPPELAPFADTGSVIYSLEPDGLTFDAPVRVTRRISADRFEGLPDTGVPVISLITTADGDGFELLGDLRVLRDGDDIYVSGDVTHFSPNAAVNEPYYFKPRVAGFQFGVSYTTQSGVPIEYGAELYDYQGQRLDLPSGVTGVGFTRHDDAVGFELGTGGLSIDCKMESESRPRVGFRFTFDAGEGGSTPGPQAIRNFIPDVERLEIMLKGVTPLTCLAPGFHGAMIQAEVVTDHPGGVASVPDQNFRGGLSAGFARFGGLEVHFEDPHAGLIKDNGDGEPGPGDTAYPAFALMEYDSMLGVTLPLWTYGHYFLYLFDGADFQASIEDALAFEEFLLEMEGNHTGDWFPGSIGLVMSFGEPFDYVVDSSEEVQQVDDAEIHLVMSRIQF
ncbi:MAG TPA: hypothetical protein VK960_07635 [Acidimicrobiia bacterium]|nr:hypothetical protein [Acidimicrobiia bacterium]